MIAAGRWRVPMRIEFPGAFYHVIARGNAKQPIFLDDHDRLAFLANLVEDLRTARLDDLDLLPDGEPLPPDCSRRATPTPLARHARRERRSTPRRFNERHERVGHVFQGRYQGLIVDRTPSICGRSARYIVLNPVRAGALPAARRDWRWSSYLATSSAARALPRRWPHRPCFELFGDEREAQLSIRSSSLRCWRRSMNTRRRTCGRSPVLGDDFDRHGISRATTTVPSAEVPKARPREKDPRPLCGRSRRRRERGHQARIGQRRLHPARHRRATSGCTTRR